MLLLSKTKALAEGMVRRRAKCVSNPEKPLQSDGPDGDRKEKKLTIMGGPRHAATSYFADKNFVEEGTTKS